MTVGIVGLGLIGGSMAKAYHEAGHTVWGLDQNQVTQEFAALSGCIDGALTQDKISTCDLILLAAYPAGSEAWLQEMAPCLVGRTVIDCLGTKRHICQVGFALAARYGFTFIGGHPMAGTHNSGLKYARSNLFHGAPMVIVPPRYDDIAFLEEIKALLAPAGFGSITVTTAEKHDEMIAFTSQLAHVVSNAYIKSPTAGRHKGFSAGSYKDLTRVAWLNPDMWTELFLENGDYLLRELDGLIGALGQYRDAIASADAPRLRQLLDEGRMRKKEIDKR